MELQKLLCHLFSWRKAHSKKHASSAKQSFYIKQELVSVTEFLRLFFHSRNRCNISNEEMKGFESQRLTLFRDARIIEGLMDEEKTKASKTTVQHWGKGGKTDGGASKN